MVRAIIVAKNDVYLEFNYEVQPAFNKRFEFI